MNADSAKRILLKFYTILQEVNNKGLMGYQRKWQENLGKELMATVVIDLGFTSQQIKDAHLSHVNAAHSP